VKDWKIICTLPAGQHLEINGYGATDEAMERVWAMVAGIRARDFPVELQVRDVADWEVGRRVEGDPR
jgi:hypothetical protein